MSIKFNDWLDVFDAEYLRSFVAGGGATVKVLIHDEGAAKFETALRERGISAGFLVATVNSGVTRVNRVDRIFTTVASQIDWVDLAKRVNRTALEQTGHQLPPSGKSPSYESVAAANGYNVVAVRSEIQRWYEREIYNDRSMSAEFRYAMAAMCDGLLKQPESGTDRDDVVDRLVDWLSGDLRLLSALRPLPIHQKVARYNARDFLISTGRWIRKSGGSGLLFIIDARRLFVSSRKDVEEGQNYYTRATAIDFFEVMRQFIDSMDEMGGIACVVGCPTEFTATESGRSMRAYTAIETRVAEEIRGRNTENPVATMVRLEFAQ